MTLFKKISYLNIFLNVGNIIPTLYKPIQNNKYNQINSKKMLDQNQNENMNSNNVYLEFPADNKALDIEREGFIHKVYGILSYQLGITFIFCLFACTDGGSEFFVYHTGLLIFMMILTFATIIPLACSQQIARTVPYNYIILTIFTVAEGYMVGFVCAFYDPASVVIVMAMTASIVFGLTIYAMYTKQDYTTMGGILVCCLIGLFVFGIIASVANVPFLKTLYCAMGAILFSVYIVVDTQLIIGKGRNVYSMDDYIMAAINIYLDIINLFLYLLELFGNKRD